MGQNLSSKVVVDTSADVFDPADKFNTRNLGLLWAMSFYGMGMIFCTTRLADRWRGPQGDRSIGFFSVFAAFILSAAWPLVLLIMRLNR